MNHPETEQTPSKSNKNRNRVLAGSLALVASGALGVAGNALENKADQFASPEQLTATETAAQAEAFQAIENLEATDLVRCNVTEIASGPMMLYQDKETPSIKLTMNVLPGDKVNEPWFQKQKIGNYEAEIKRRNPSVNISQNFNPTDERGPRDTGVAILVKDFNPDKSYDPFDSYSTETDKSSPAKTEVFVALNDIEAHPGKRMIEIRENVSPVMLIESLNGKSITGEVKKMRAMQACATINIDLPIAGEPYISSAVDTEGHAIPVKQ